MRVYTYIQIDSFIYFSVVVHQLVDAATVIVHRTRGLPGLPLLRSRPLFRASSRAQFLRFTKEMVRKLNLPIQVLLVSMVYLDKGGERIGFELSVDRWAKERVLLGALILATKVPSGSRFTLCHRKLNSVYSTWTTPPLEMLTGHAILAESSIVRRSISSNASFYVP